MAVVHDCEYAARLPDARGLLVAHFRIEPMPRRRCEHRIKAGVARRPRFEGAGDDLDPRELFKIATRNRREILAELDASDAASAPRKMPRSLPGAGSNFQHCGIVPETTNREQVIEDLIGIVGTSLVVELGVVIESPFQFVAISINHGIQNIVSRATCVRMASEPRAARLVFVQ